MTVDLKRKFPLRFILRIPQFFKRKGEWFDRVEYLLYQEWWEHPQHSTWRHQGIPENNRPYDCILRVREMRKR